MKKHFKNLTLAQEMAIATGLLIAFWVIVIWIFCKSNNWHPFENISGWFRNPHVSARF